jgi:hypothetical protein
MAGVDRRFGIVATGIALGWLTGIGAAMADGGRRSVRGVDGRTQEMLHRAVEVSPTIARLVATLDQSDVVVMVQLTWMPSSAGGDTRLITATAGWRYLIVRVDLTRSPDEQVEWLGHELQHANEVATATDVRDEVGLAALMARIGRRTGRGTFETDDAVRVGRLVRAEVAGRKRR